MTRRTRHIDNKQAEAVRNKTRNGFENDLLADNEDSLLFETIGEYMKGAIDIEEVMSDPDLSTAKDAVREMMADYNRNKTVNKENEKFIRDTFSGEGSETGLTDEIKIIKKEIIDNKLNDITAEWVKEWHERKQRTGVIDPKTEEIRNFITGAIDSPVSEPVKIVNKGSSKGSRRNLFIRYASLSAAALIGAFLLLRTLLPSSDPEKLFNSYYKPFDAVSPVTRSVNNNEADIYSSAIGSYKTGDYQNAAAGFGNMLKKDPSGASAKFFLGLSQLALGNYDQAINLLSAVANESGEYGKEARWYLGLSYLKTGNKSKAAECFEFLSRSGGFYREPSLKILRRLK